MALGSGPRPVSFGAKLTFATVFAIIVTGFSWFATMLGRGAERLNQQKTACVDAGGQLVQEYHGRYVCVKGLDLGK